MESYWAMKDSILVGISWCKFITMVVNTDQLTDLKMLEFYFTTNPSSHSVVMVARLAYKWNIAGLILAPIVKIFHLAKWLLPWGQQWQTTTSFKFINAFKSYVEHRVRIFASRFYLELRFWYESRSSLVAQSLSELFFAI